jgi:H+/Cl- antiporter ClcA
LELALLEKDFSFKKYIQTIDMKESSNVLLFYLYNVIKRLSKGKNSTLCLNASKISSTFARIMGRINNLFRRFNIWRLRNITERQFVLFLSVLVGAVSGLAAVLLKNLIHFSIRFIEHNLIDKGEYLYLIFPIIGITVTYLFVKYIVKDNISHGVTRVLYAISKRNSMIKPHNTWTSMLASTITISFGGSVGAEAPVVLTGSAIGSNLARLFKLNYRTITLMVGCGAAGAVAGIFKAPLTGLLFTLEVLMLDLNAFGRYSNNNCLFLYG